MEAEIVTERVMIALFRKIIISALSVICLTGCGNSASDVSFYSDSEVEDILSSSVNEKFVLNDSVESGDCITYEFQLVDRDNLVFHVYNEKIDSGVSLHDNVYLKGAHNWSAKLSSDYVSVIISANKTEATGMAWKYGADIDFRSYDFDNRKYYITFSINSSSDFENLSKACADIDSLFAFNISDESKSSDFDDIYFRVLIRADGRELRNLYFSTKPSERWTAKNLLDAFTNEYNNASASISERGDSYDS